MRLTASSITVAALLNCVGVQAQAATESVQLASPIDTTASILSPSYNVNPDLIINPNIDIVTDVPSSGGVSSLIGSVVRDPLPPGFTLNLAPGDLPAFITCSGELSFTGGSHAVYGCSANLSIGSGFVQADTSLTFNATGQIVLDTVWFNTPAVTLNAGDTVTVNGAIYMVQNGASLTINTAVPEPSTYTLMGLGLVSIALLTRRRPLA
jgi:hypothetical protein